MGPRPFTLQQANSITKDFMHLVGQPFGGDPEATIKHILVSPFDEENKGIFLRNYKKWGSRPDELDGYVGHFYDVLVLANNGDDVQYDHIRNYARENHHSYVFPEYPFN